MMNQTELKALEYLVNHILNTEYENKAFFYAEILKDYINGLHSTGNTK